MELGLTSLSTIFQLYRGAQFYSWRTPEYSGKTINLSFLLHVTDGRMRVWRHKDTAYTPRNIQPTVPYGGGSVMVWGVSLMTANWILVTIQGNWSSVHQRRLATSCCPPFRQPPTSYKACVYGWKRQASSFKSSNHLPPKRSRDFCFLASHEPGF